MNAAPPSPDAKPIPALITFEPQTRDIVIGAIKLVHKRLKSKGVVDAALEYQDLLRDPAAMQSFIQGFKANRDIASELTVDATGKTVGDDDAKLICNLTLAQIERLLVITCAKKVAASRAAAPPSAKSGAAKGKPAPVSAELPDAIKDVIAYDWQLPLLSLYLEALKEDHFRVLGPRLLLLRSLDTLTFIAGLDPADIRKAERTMGPDCDLALAKRPEAVRGGALCTPKSYKLLKSTSGKLLWEILSAEPQVLVELLALPSDRIVPLAPFAAKMSAEAFRQIEAVPAPLLEPMLGSFQGVFGDLSQELIADDEFAKKFLFGMIGTVRSLPSNSEKDLAAAPQVLAYKWQALRDPITEWWQSRTSR